MFIGAEPIAAGRSPRRKLDDFSPHPDIFIRPATEGELGPLVELAAKLIPALQGSLRAVERVQRYSGSILAISNRDETAGCFAMLLLNPLGLSALRDGRLSVADPAHEHLVPIGTNAEAIYVWSVFAVPGTARKATGNVMQWLRQDAYAKADLYARPGTLNGRAFMTRSGFRPLKSDLWFYSRSSSSADS